MQKVQQLSESCWEVILEGPEKIKGQKQKEKSV